ncbi:MAG TPA: outer membrane beta-barrel protein [Bryobacteraceae bacterium]|nr:outer membrane beta-barrel protein [Bryobacteraceae bacterium]
MRLVAQTLQVLIMTLPGMALAGELEIGGAAGFGFYQSATISNADGSASATYGSRFALSGFAEWDFSRWLGIEGRYIFQDGDPKLTSQGLEASLDGQTQAVTAEMVFHATPKGSRWTVFVPVGGGFKDYQNTQTIPGARPLSDFASLVTGSQICPVFSAGAGVKFAISQHWHLRVEFRYYDTPFPSKSIAAAPGSQVHGWMPDIVPTLGISRVF